MKHSLLAAAALLGSVAGWGCSGAEGSGALDLSVAVKPGAACYDVRVEGATLDLVFAAPEAGSPGGHGAAHEVFHTRSVDGGASWSRAVRVDAGCAPVTSTHQWVGPQIAGRGDDLAVVWTSSGSGFMGRGPMVTALSNDGGASWRPGPEPAALPDRGGQAFVDVVADSGGGLHLIWLGKRGQPEGPKGLYYTHSDDAGKSWSEVEAVDSETCECCWNRLWIDADDGLFLLYRDLGPRDMSVAHKPAGQPWRSLGTSGDFDWQFDGCPHVGGDVVSLAGEEASSVHTVVWSGKEEVAGVHYLRLADLHAGGSPSWAAPLGFGDRTAKHADLGRGTDGSLALLWDQAAGVAGSSVWLARSRDQGLTWSDPEVLSAGDAVAEYPGAFRWSGGLRAFWFEERDDRRVLVSRELESSEVSG